MRAAAAILMQCCIFLSFLPFHLSPPCLIIPALSSSPIQRGFSTVPLYLFINLRLSGKLTILLMSLKWITLLTGLVRGWIHIFFKSILKQVRWPYEYWKRVLLAVIPVHTRHELVIPCFQCKYPHSVQKASAVWAKQIKLESAKVLLVQNDLFVLISIFIQSMVNIPPLCLADKLCREAQDGILY